jgi:hypothetical protein
MRLAKKHAEKEAAFEQEVLKEEAAAEKPTLPNNRF